VDPLGRAHILSGLTLGCSARSTVRRKHRRVSERAARRGLARISPSLRNFVPVSGLPSRRSNSVQFATHYSSTSGSIFPRDRPAENVPAGKCVWLPGVLSLRRWTLGRDVLCERDRPSPITRFRKYSRVFHSSDQPLPYGHGSVPAHRAATVRAVGPG
jgi:hypothetical protein